MQKLNICSLGTKQKGMHIEKLDFTSEGSTKEDTKNANTRSCNGENYRMNFQLRRKFIGSQLQNSPFKEKAYGVQKKEIKKQKFHRIQKEETKMYIPKKIGFDSQKLQTFKGKSRLIRTKQYEILDRNMQNSNQQKNSDTSQSCQSQGFWVFRNKNDIQQKQEKRTGVNINSNTNKRSPTNFKHGSPKPRFINRSPFGIQTCGKQQFKGVRHLRIQSQQTNGNNTAKQQFVQVNSKIVPKSQNQSVSKIRQVMKIKVFSPGRDFGKQSAKVERTFIPNKIVQTMNRKHSYISSQNDDQKSKKQSSVQLLKRQKQKKKEKDSTLRLFADIKFCYYGQKHSQQALKAKNILNKVSSLKNLADGNLINSQLSISGFTSRDKKQQQKQTIQAVPNKRFQKYGGTTSMHLFKKTNTPKYKPPSFFFSRKNAQNDINQIKSDPDIKQFFSPGKSKIQSICKVNGSSKNIPTMSEISKKSRTYLTLKSISLQVNGQANCFQFEIIRKLEENKNVHVKVALHLQTNSVYVLKGFKKTPQNIETFIKESKVQFFIDNKNVVKLYGIFQDQNNVYLLIEYLQNGSLFHEKKKLIDTQIILKSKQLKGQSCKMEQKQQKEKLKKVRNIGRQILDGIAYLHKQNIIHRDIKSHNIFVSNGQYKIGDYGSSTFTNSMQFVGTIDYAAPQIIQRVPYDRSIDIWSLGCVLFQIYVGFPPFYDQQRMETYRKIINVEYSRNKIQKAGSEFADLIDLMLKKNPKQRITADKALNHLFFKESDQNTRQV